MLALWLRFFGGLVAKDDLWSFLVSKSVFWVLPVLPGLSQ